MKQGSAFSRLAPSIVSLALLVGACTSAESSSDGDLYPDVGEKKLGVTDCGKELISWNGTTAYSNGELMGKKFSCAGEGPYGYRYQCVELVMRHFTLNWGLSWWGDAEQLLDNAPTSLVEVYKDGDLAHPPVPGDMIVFGGGEVGHVALVTDVTGTSVTIIEQNVPTSFTRTLKLSNGKVAPGWSGWWTKGWAHAKANGGSSGPPAWNCGASEYNGQQYWTCEGGDLHRCEGGAPVLTECGDAGCTVGAIGTDDTCNGPPQDPPPQDPPQDPPPQDPPQDPPPQDPPAIDWQCSSSAYGGAQYWTCSGDNRYRCEGGQPVEDVCEAGCLARSLGQDDLCVSSAPGWSCAGSAYGGGQYWTCSGGDIFRCEGGQPVKVSCPGGCNVQALGTDDTCN